MVFLGCTINHNTTHKIRILEIDVCNFVCIYGQIGNRLCESGLIWHFLILLYPKWFSESFWSELYFSSQRNLFILCPLSLLYKSWMLHTWLCTFFSKLSVFEGVKYGSIKKGNIQQYENVNTFFSFWYHAFSHEVHEFK